MKTISVTLFSMAISTVVGAQSPEPETVVFAASPDHHYEVVASYSEMRVRDTRTKQLLENPSGVYLDLYDPTNVSVNTAFWSPDSHKVALSCVSSKHGGGDCVVFAVLGSKLVRLHLPADALPVKWTGANTLLCSIRTEAILTLDSKTATFARRKAEPSHK